MTPKYWKDRVVSYTYGYPRVYWPEHPMADGAGMVKIHRAVMSEALGRSLSPNEHVHHKNEDKSDWRVENLELVTPSEHTELHSDERNKGRPRQLRVCAYCGASKKVLHNDLVFAKSFCDKKCQAKFQKKGDWPADSELSNLVWSKPSTEVSKDLGISESALRKRCRKRGIAKPGRGYWLRK